jgi:hypothetical protein
MLKAILTWLVSPNSNFPKGPNPKLRKDERVYHPALGYGHIQTVDHQVTLNGKEIVLVRVTFDLGQSAKFAMELLRPLAANQDTVAIQDEILRSLRQMLRQKQESEEPGL